MPAPVAPVAPPDEIDFSADRVSYDDNSSLVIAEGAVRMTRDGYWTSTRTAVEWNRDTEASSPWQCRNPLARRRRVYRQSRRHRR